MTLQNHSSLQPGPFPGAGQPGLRCARPRACLPNTRPPTSQSAPGIAPSQPARTSVLQAAPRRLPPLVGGRPAPEGWRRARLCSRGLGLHGRPAGTYGASAPLAACAPGAGPVPVRMLPQAPPACRSAGSSLVTSEFVNTGCVYNAVSSSLSSFAAMDGVPFMISEKFSCVPESVSVTLELPPLPPPAARAPSAQQHAGLPRRPSHSCLHGGHFCPAPCPAGSAALRPPTGLPGSCSGPRCPPGLSAGAAHDRRVRVREKRKGDGRAERPSFVVAPVTVTWPELHWS